MRVLGALVIVAAALALVGLFIAAMFLAPDAPEPPRAAGPRSRRVA